MIKSTIEPAEFVFKFGARSADSKVAVKIKGVEYELPVYSLKAEIGPHTFPEFTFSVYGKTEETKITVFWDEKTERFITGLIKENLPF